MKLDIKKEWCIEAAKREGDAEVGAGFESIPITRCPTCHSPDPARHPAVQPDGGEVQLCRDPWHSPVAV